MNLKDALRINGLHVPKTHDVFIASQFLDAGRTGAKPDTCITDELHKRNIYGKFLENDPFYQECLRTGYIQGLNGQ